jgi:hypothetical protein
MLRWLLQRWPIRLRDDRGRDVDLVPRPKYQRSDIRGTWMPRYIGPNAAHAVELDRHKRTSAIYGAIVGGSFFVTGKIAHTLLAGVAIPGKIFVVPLIVGVCWLPLFPLLLRHARGRMRMSLRDAYLAARHCASCDYDLARTPAESDGCTPCPECGAAWKLAATTRAAP